MGHAEGWVRLWRGMKIKRERMLGFIGWFWGLNFVFMNVNWIFRD